MEWLSWEGEGDSRGRGGALALGGYDMRPEEEAGGREGGAFTGTPSTGATHVGPGTGPGSGSGSPMLSVGSPSGEA